MRTLFDSPFFESIRECIKTSQTPPPDILMAHYGDFHQALASDIEKEESVLSQFRYLRLVHIEICSYYKQMEGSGARNTSVLVTLLWKALGIVEIELDVIRLHIKHYGLMQAADTGNQIPVYWSKEYTISDLMELVVALHESKALVYRDGRQVSLAALVRLFGGTFNIDIKDPRKLKSKLTSRKIKAIKFLDVLSANFIDLCNN